MVLSWLNVGIIIFGQINYVLGQTVTHKTSPSDWRKVEALAEEHPYIVALLNASRDYFCTGITINKRTVLTSGSCIDPSLRFISLGSAVLSKKTKNSSLFEIASTVVHVDYIFELQSRDPNVTRMHSNVGLVFSVLPNLEAYMPSADLSNYYATELQQMNLRVVGFGRISETNLVVLQQQLYHQTPCTNPKWYYCICGFELSSNSKTYEKEFGKGAPVFLGSEVVGVTAAPCGSLELKTTMAKYNIFTVIGPYVPWIDKTYSNITKKVFRARNCAQKQTFHHYVYILLIMSEVIQ